MGTLLRRQRDAVGHCVSWLLKESRLTSLMPRRRINTFTVARLRSRIGCTRHSGQAIEYHRSTSTSPSPDHYSIRRIHALWIATTSPCLWRSQQPFFHLPRSGWLMSIMDYLPNQRMPRAFPTLLDMRPRSRCLPKTYACLPLFEHRTDK